MTLRVPTDWWKSLFDEVYLVTDARSVCDDTLTRREADVICELLPLESSDEILDLCGGHGRHSLELSARGFGRCTVFDYSACLLAHGQARATERGEPISFVQGDARSTGLASESFEHVLIMGNSLGYIADEGADAAILAEAHRVARPGAWLLVDAADGDAIAASFAENSWHEIGDDTVVCRQRELQGSTLCVREVVLSKQKGLVRDGGYAIRLVERAALSSAIEGAGFSEVKAHTDLFLHRAEGDYGFLNKRMILTARKETR